MNILNDFIKLLVGNFDNSEQIEILKSKDITNFPLAKHVNNICTNKITDLPNDFKGIFLLEESYYLTKGHTTYSPHLFLFTEEGENIKLTSFEIPEGYKKSTFTYDNFKEMKYSDLTLSKRFTPAIYKKINGVWEGGSVSMFSPTLKFTLLERFSEEQLEVSETMEENSRRIFGFDEPIIYKRII